MQTFAHVTAGVVDVVEQIPDGLTPGVTIFTAAYAADLVMVPSAQAASIAVGWTYADSAFVPPPVTQARLLAYANQKQWSLATGGYTITVNSAALVFPTDVVSMGLITGKAARVAQPNPPASFEWQTPTGFVTIAAADFISVATQIADFVQATFNALAIVFAAIEAGATTTTAEIDAAAWPSNVSTTPA